MFDRSKEEQLQALQAEKKWMRRKEEILDKLLERMEEINRMPEHQAEAASKELLPLLKALIRETFLSRDFGCKESHDANPELYHKQEMVIKPRQIQCVFCYAVYPNRRGDWLN